MGRFNIAFHISQHVSNMLGGPITPGLSYHIRRLFDLPSLPLRTDVKASTTGDGAQVDGDPDCSLRPINTA